MKQCVNRVVALFLIGVSLTGCGSVNKMKRMFGRNEKAESLYRVALRARMGGNPESAIKFYTKVLEEDPDMAKAYLGLAEAYIDMKLLDAAEINLKKAVAKKAQKDRVAYLRGKCYLLRGNLPAAKAQFSKYRTDDCMNALGAVYDNIGDHAKAQQLYKQVIVSNPKYIDAYNNMGLSLMLVDDYRNAIFYLENACTLPDANATYRGNLALAYGLSGQFSKARAVYAQDYDGEELEQKIAYLEDIVSKRK